MQPNETGEVADASSSGVEEKERKAEAPEGEVRRLEAIKGLSKRNQSGWRTSDPLVLAILAGTLTLLGNLGVAFWNSHSTTQQDREKARDNLRLETEKARYSLVLQAMATNNPDISKRNILFFIDAGLLNDDDCKIREAIEKDQPVLPALSAITPSFSGTLHSAPEIAKLYDFPLELDGRGQTIGFLELGGALNRDDLRSYFKSFNLPVPEVSSISVDGFTPRSDKRNNSQVMMDIEIAGSIAPRAHIELYFAPSSGDGIRDAIRMAVQNRVAVFSSGWAMPESKWSQRDVTEINNSLEEAAQNDVTVIATAGYRGVTDGVKDGKRHVDFPASSPWVLSVGGTTLRTADGHIESETVWNSRRGFATGGGVSEIFDRPQWQLGLPVPPRANGKPGRGIPDIVASASPENGFAIVVAGKINEVGGPSASVPMIDALVADIDQALGYRVGYFNPQLYQEIGPAGAFRFVKTGDNGSDGVAGYSAQQGWSPVAGWGSPDGMRLLNWFINHPKSNRKNLVQIPCPVR